MFMHCVYLAAIAHFIFDFFGNKLFENNVYLKKKDLDGEDWMELECLPSCFAEKLKSMLAEISVAYMEKYMLDNLSIFMSFNSYSVLN